MISLLVDTDPGVDDALAIMMAARASGCELAALFTVGGNVGLEAVTRNALRLKELLGLSAPVYPGCSHPLVLPGEDAAYVHGQDGFGDCDLPQPGATPGNEHAALALVRMARQAPGRHSLLALGPLTNIALALHLEPELPGLVRRFVIMGGAFHAGGNTPRSAAEFNFFADPEAARFVLDHWPGAEIVDWELVTRNGVPMAELERWLAADTTLARFYGRISGRVRQWLATRGAREFFSADPLAMAVMLEPELVQQACTRGVRVELSGELSRGQSVVDWRGDHPHLPQHRLILQVDTARFHRLLRQVLLEN